MKMHSDDLVISPRSQADGPPFRTVHELAEILEALGQHLQSKNRIELDESGFYSHLAETLRKIGRLTTLPMDFPAVDEEFGNAYLPGTLAHDEQARHFLSLVRSQSNDKGVD